ncbi:plasmid partitioning protein RepB [Rhizobium sp. L1K21]|uniref:plasmid partitioning protein RepB n=1 Tax=Rhizobium sp. L1K21 TaxID=2954933 RepID=UPI002093A3EE|nr:plasmid partitioning protein RepB [Rhizobium sp. L1K21]MCO6188550.1 plasmid partitioning protein RepB [Rhizobium sp. L1K21]
MNKRKSIAASFGLLNASLEADDAAKESQQSSASSVPAAPRVGAGVIGATQRALGEIRDERDRLKSLLESGAVGREIDTSLIDPSPFPDRLPDDDEEEFESFKRSIAEEGQKIPVQLRPHPEIKGRYQVIFGHRRVRAAEELGVPVLAIVADIADRDLIISQGIENAARQNLTWIERALFAWRLDEEGFRPRDIYATLSIDDAELARMRAVCRTVPGDIIRLIGRAPKIGRPRWLSLANTLKEEPSGLEKIAQTLSADRIGKMDSNARFAQALRAITEKKPGKPKKHLRLSDSTGRDVAEATFSETEIHINLLNKKDREFASFLRAELPRLAEKFSSLQTDDER